MKKSYLRDTAVDSVNKLLGNLRIANHLPVEAIRMVDREIGGLLAHDKSPFFVAYRQHAMTFFPSGLESTEAGHDIILVLNNPKALVKGRQVDIPSTLKHPEKGVVQIIGPDLAKQLFIVRGEILEELLQEEIYNKGIMLTWRDVGGTDTELLSTQSIAKKGRDPSTWQINIDANEKALETLEAYCINALQMPSTITNNVHNNALLQAREISGVSQ